MTEPLLKKKSLRGASSSIQAGEPHPPLINMLNLISFIFSFWEFSFSLPLLGQINVQSAPKAAFSLESEGFEGACCSPSLYFPPFFFHTSPLPFPSMAKPPVSFPSFSNFAKVSSPFLQRAVCSLTEFSKKSKEQDEEIQPQEVDTSSLAFSNSPNFIYFLFFFPLSDFVYFCRCWHRY